MMAMRVRRTQVDQKTFVAAHRATGSIYFIRDENQDCVKIGHSRRPWRRLTELQIGNPCRLAMIGLVAADVWVEELVHDLCKAGHARGEWFLDRTILSPWLAEMTEGQPFYRWIWEAVSHPMFGPPSDPMEWVRRPTNE